MPSLTLPAPAKLNLFLHINGQRPDGYHDLQTLFQLLDYGDELSFEVTAGTNIAFTCSDASLNGEDNLVVQAAKLLAVTNFQGIAFTLAAASSAATAAINI